MKALSLIIIIWYSTIQLSFSSGENIFEFPIFCAASSSGYSFQFEGPPIQNNESVYDEWLAQAKIPTSTHSTTTQNLIGLRKISFPLQIQATDLLLYDRKAKRFTVDKFLADINTRYGKIDSVLFWPAYPNIGIDDRNQFDWLESIPGGLDSVRSAIDQFQMNGVRVYLPYNPWDTGTRRANISNNCSDVQGDYVLLKNILNKTRADGIFGDTMGWNTIGDMNKTFFDETDTILEPEGGGSVLTMNWTISGWGEDWNLGKSPCISAFKWLEPRRMSHQVHRWNKDKTTDIQFSLFNGVGYVSWENIFGIWNGMTELGSRQVQLIGVILRNFAYEIRHGQWMPHYPTKVLDLFASVWTKDRATLIILINRSGKDLPSNTPLIDIGKLIDRNTSKNTTVFDCYHGERLDSRNSTIYMEVEELSFGCLYLYEDEKKHPKPDFVQEMQFLTLKPLKALNNDWEFLPQVMIREQSTPPINEKLLEEMIELPETLYQFNTESVIIEGPVDSGVDVQFPWEDRPQRKHSKALKMPKLFIDKNLVTNSQWQKYLRESDYVPEDKRNYLLFWNTDKQTFSKNLSDSPVTWISPKEAQLFCRFYNKRLPHAYEWQYAAQGETNFTYPWGNNEPTEDLIPKTVQSNNLPPPPPIGSYPKGDSIFGVSDMVGLVWQWTDTFEDIHQRTNLIKGGSYYYPIGSDWYFPHAIRVDKHNRYLMMDESYDRAGTVGFRCVADSTQRAIEK